MAVLGNSFAAGNTGDQLADDSPDTSGIDWTGIASALGTSAAQIVTQVTQPAPFTQLPNGTVVTAAGQVVPGTNPANSISGSTLLIVFVLAALVFFIKK